MGQVFGFLPELSCDLATKQRQIHVHTMQLVGAAPLDSDPFTGFSPRRRPKKPLFVTD